MSRRIRCPVCGRNDRDKTCVVLPKTDKPGHTYHCYRCAETAGPDHWKAIKDALGDSPGTDTLPVTRADERYTTLSDWGWRIWRETRPLEGAALAYLRARHCAVPPADGDLRWHPELKADDTHTGPALVGLVTHAVTNEPLSLHRTWIRPDGTKDGPGRRFLSRHTMKHGVCRLWPDEAVETGLFLAEGIETALSVAASGWRPTWAALSAGTLRAMPVLAGIECLTVFADKDSNGVGQCAALACAATWEAAGVDVEVWEPDRFGDFNDEVMRHDTSR